MVRTAVLTVFLMTALTMNSAAVEEWVAFTGSGVPVPAQTEVSEQNRDSIVVNMFLDGMNVQEKREYDGVFQLISIPQAGSTKETGRPRLPVVRTLLMIPSDSDVTVYVEEEEYTILKDYRVYPVGREVVKHRGEAEYIGEEFFIDEEFYSTDELYPRESASISFSGYLRDQRLVQLEFRPIRYNPFTRELMCYSFLRVRLDYGSGDFLPGVGPLSSICQYSIANYSISGAPPASALGPTQAGEVSYPDDFMGRHIADYVIIVPDLFYDNQRLRNLADWRAEHSGLDVMVVPIGKLYHQFGSGQSIDESIRAFVDYIYDYWKSENMPDGRVGYVLLIGDVELLPTHNSDLKSFDEQVVTDNWYVCVSGDDLMPDVMLGRLPAKSQTELNRMIDKIIQYEQDPLYGDWANNALLMLGTVESLRDDLETARDEYLLPAGYNVSEVSALDGGSASNVISRLNAGQLIVDYAGHGWVNGWEVFQKSDIPRLSNARKPPAIFSLACSTGQFDYPDSDSLAEAFLKDKGGAIAFFGSSRLASISDVGFGLSEAIAQAHMGTLGEITMHTKLKLLPQSIDMELYNLLGDPALDLYAARRQPDKVDLVVSPIDISFAPQEPKQGEETQIDVVIHNLGTANARDVIIELRDVAAMDQDTQPAGGTLIETYNIPEIAAGDRFEVQAVWRPPLGEAQHDISVEVFPLSRTTEYYRENNDARKTLLVSLAAEGWPVDVEDRILSAPMAADIDGDGDMELLIQSLLNDTNRVYLLHHDGQPLSGWPRAVSRGGYGFYGQYSNPSAGPAPAVGDLDGDGTPEIVAVFFGQEVYAWRSDGSVLPGWPVRTSGYATSSPMLADLDGDGKLEVAFGLADGRMNIRRSDGSAFPGWPVYVGQQGHLFPLVTDMDGDGDMEIAALLSPLPKTTNITASILYAWHHDGTAVKGWPVQLEGIDGVLPPSAGDLDGDGMAEIVAPSIRKDVCKIYVWKHDGSLAPGWPVTTDEEVESAITLGDLDQDGDIEIIACAGEDYVYAWHHDGKQVFGWPVSLGSYARWNSSPVLGDVDGDGIAEVILTSYGGVVHALKNDGTPVQGWPAITEERYTSSPPVIADLNGDTRTELVYASGSKKIHMLSLVGYQSTGVEWSMFLHDQLHTGSYDAKAILPQPPGNLQAVDVSDDKGGSIAISWDLSPDDSKITGYIIYRSEKYDGQYSMVGKTSRGASEYIDATGLVGVIYWYVVRASDGMYLSPNLTPVSAYSVNNFAPDPPGTVTAYNGDIDKTINVWWSEGEENDLAGYKIYYGVSSRKYGEPVIVGMANHYAVAGLTNGTAYYISVTAYDTEGNESLFSGEVVAMPQDEDTAPPTFSRFQPNQVAEGVPFYVRCNITDPSGIYDNSSEDDAQGVYLAWDSDGELLESSHKMQMSLLSSDTYVTDARLPGQLVDARFVYKVYAYDNDYDWENADDRLGGSSQEQMVTFVSTLSEAYNYPNPAPAEGFGDKTVFRYRSASDADVKIKIYDVAGNLVEELEARTDGGKYDEKEWDISSIASGVYVYIIEIQPSSGTKHIIKKKLAIIK